MSDVPETTVTEDTAVSSNGNLPKDKFEMPFSLREKLQDIPEALNYIGLLERQIQKQRKKIRRIKAKLKMVESKVDASCQTEPLPITVESREPKSISEEIKEAAELALQETDYVYDESLGLYYVSSSGFYYNAEFGLYYNPKNSTWYKYVYNEETKSYEYEYHSHAYSTLPEEETTKELVKRKQKSKDEPKASKCVRLEEASWSCEMEDGECSMSSGRTTSEDNNSDSSDICKQWPCMRVMVEKSSNPKIKIGLLNLVTYEGGTLGREGKDHAIEFPDINISKCHLKFTFDKEKNLFFATDMGSRNGTILNGKRMSSSKQESEALPVPHGSRIQVGAVILLCHIHEGDKTCGLCEPGLVQSLEKKVEVFPKSSKSEQHRNELKKLKKKFGVTGFEEGGSKLASGYVDRAQKRRDTVGSQNPHEKTETASLNESISSQNRGFKLLAKMGWKEGQSLGKDNQGIVEPIPLVGNVGTSGMGSEEPVVIESSYDKNKQIIWKKTQERFQRLPAATNVFEESD